jgi:hypothetical protein
VRGPWASPRLGVCAAQETRSISHDHAESGDDATYSAARNAAVTSGPAEEVWGGGRVGVGRRRLATLRRFVVVALVSTVIVSISGCNGDGDDVDENAVTSTTAAGTTEAELDAAATDLRELLDSTPQAIAEDMSALGLVEVTADQVRNVARTLCDSTFDPDVTTVWLQSLMVTNLAMLGPANRLLRYSGTPEVCARGPTTAERDFYRAEVYRVLEPTPPVPPGATQVPSHVEAVVCDLLGAEDAGDAVGATLDRLLDLASRGQVDAQEFLPFVVEVAGAGCDQNLPIAIEALDRQLGA